MTEQRLGILGGMGPQATQDFYQRILDLLGANELPRHQGFGLRPKRLGRRTRGVGSHAAA